MDSENQSFTKMMIFELCFGGQKYKKEVKKEVKKLVKWMTR